MPSHFPYQLWEGIIFAEYLPLTFELQIQFSGKMAINIKVTIHNTLITCNAECHAVCNPLQKAIPNQAVQRVFEERMEVVYTT